MTGLETALGLITLVDVCLTRGTELYRMCKSFRTAERDIRERAIRIRTCWQRVHHQLKVLKEQRVDEDMEFNPAINFSEILALLSSKLEKCRRMIEPLLPLKTEASDDVPVQTMARTSPQQFFFRAKFVFLKKEALDQAIDDLETWQKIFDPSWFLTIKALSHVTAGSTIFRAGDQTLCERFPSLGELRRSGTMDSTADTLVNSAAVFLDPAEVDIGLTIDANLPFSHVRLGCRKDKFYLLDPVTCPRGRDVKSYAKDIKSLAKKLSSADPARFNLFSCKGVIKSRDNFTFVFNVPKSFGEPRSLRALLLQSKEPGTLTDRFQVAKDLVNSVLFVHYFSFVHKNIRPEAIWVLRREAGTGPELSTFLLGFEDFRHEDGRTGKVGDLRWARNLYRHPERQGQQPQEIYTMQHDMYSLGVCMLEIGLWHSLVEYKDNCDVGTPSKRLEDTLKTVAASDKLLSLHALLEMTESQLPRVMGIRYAQVVRTCLTCLEPNNADFGDSAEFEDDDGLQVGMRYVQKIYARLLEIQV